MREGIAGVLDIMGKVSSGSVASWVHRFVRE